MVQDVEMQHARVLRFTTGAQRQVSGPRNRTGEREAGWADKQVGKVKGGSWVVTNSISASNWAEGVCIKAGAAVGRGGNEAVL